MLYNYICERCGYIGEVSMRMKDVGVVKVYCQDCSKTAEYDINGVEMYRYYSVDGLPTPNVPKSIGSLLDKKSHQRPKEHFTESLEKQRKENDKNRPLDNPSRIITS